MKKNLKRLSFMLMLAFATTVSLTSCGNDGDAAEGENTEMMDGDAEHMDGDHMDGEHMEGEKCGRDVHFHEDSLKKCEGGRKCEEGKCQEGKCSGGESKEMKTEGESTEM